MRIKAIHLPAFGRLSHFSAEMSPGLNVVFGHNEAGKSTLQQAICAMLYGFYDGERARPDETARHDRFRPWDGGPYRGSMDYILDDRREYEVRRDFSSTDVVTQVIDSVLGTDVSPQFGRARHGNVPFAKQQLGMSRAVFRSCAFISQGEVVEINKGASPSEIGDAIAALADSARRDVSAARAIDRLDKALDKIGSDRARTAKLPVARDRLANAKRELDAADQVRRDVAARAERLDETQRRHRELSERLVELRYLIQTTEVAKLEARLQAVDDAAAKAARSLAERESLLPVLPIAPGLRDEVVTLKGGLGRSREAVDRAAAQRGEAAAAVTPSERLEFEALSSSVGQMTSEQRRELEAIAYRDAPRWGLMAAIGRILRAMVTALARLIPGKRREQPAPETPVFSQDEARDLLDRHQRYLTLRPHVERVDTAERQLKAEAAALAETEAQLLATVRSAGVQKDSMDGALETFESAWRRHEAYSVAARAHDEACRELELVLQGSTREQLEARVIEHRRTNAEMLAERPTLAELVVRDGRNLEPDFRRTQEEAHRAEVEASTLDQEVRLTLERHKPRAELEEEVAHWGREVSRLETSRAALALARGTIEEAMAEVYRDFAPAVNSFLSEGIELATEGRYRRAHVDPSTLCVSLLVPETGMVVTDPPVSHGTRTLIYVLMRIGLAQHMSAIGESVPLILDDPFVDLDSRRLPRVLDFLLGLSERMQILLFTKDEKVLEWLNQSPQRDECRIHEMDVLTPA